ncbi:MAG: hypothetical protein E7256_01375 [Lachnospiraceae bacterium]|nr:hypothetical protein [Lachnospiraceae bacterium]
MAREALGAWRGSDGAMFGRRLGQNGGGIFDYQTGERCLIFKDSSPILFALSRTSAPSLPRHAPRASLAITMRFKRRNALWGRRERGERGMQDEGDSVSELTAWDERII